MKLDQQNIKKILNENNLKIWQLCRFLNISKSTYYKYSHVNFKGYEKQLKHAINHLINSPNKKAGAVDAD